MTMMNALWSRSTSSSGDSAEKSAKPPSDAVSTTSEQVADLSDRPNAPALPARPALHRNQPSAPPPAAPSNPPPPVPSGAGSGNAANNASAQPQDSLSLAQLRRIVAEFPKSEPIAYDYVYTDVGPIEEEVDEWFLYNFWQWVRLNTANRAFDSTWESMFGEDETWDSVGDDDRQRFVRNAVQQLQTSTDKTARGEAIGTLVYIVLGRWAETVKAASLPNFADHKVRSAATKQQLDAMKAGVKLLAECGGIPPMWDALRRAFEPFWADDGDVGQIVQAYAEELMHLMTILYISLQTTLDDLEDMASARKELLALNPNLVHFMLHATAKLRWDDRNILPQTQVGSTTFGIPGAANQHRMLMSSQVFLLFWKSLLLVFGGSKHIAEAKKATAETPSDVKDKEIITASPLDYHVFRQEITSKYPSYIPPQCAIPLEAEQTSILPPLPNHPTRNNGQNGILPGPPNQSASASILHQPVHIATPAPSPPPSPGVGGKGGKKQNYQTNQNFPFMYPPLDATSNSAGGKGVAGLQDLLVGRKWEGSDVPASIIEAGELFSTRTRMTRATRQLWEERERFLKFERGWEGVDEDLIDELDLSELTLEEKEELGLLKESDKKKDKLGHEIDLGPRPVDDDIKHRLEAVEEFYKEALPHLQSLVIVLLKAIVAIASSLVQPQPGQQNPGAPQNNGRVSGGPPQGRGQSNGNNAGNDPPSPSDDNVDEARSREIAAKAVTGIMILLLKWLKLSHILKFEYFTQLLLDSNYLPLVLKLFALHDVQQVVESKTDRIEHSFFYFCGSRAGAIPQQGLINPTATDFEDVDVSEDEAAPPAIKRNRSPPGAEKGGPPDASSQFISSQPPQQQQQQSENSGVPSRPEVDELGYPVNPLPKEPITDFSRRNFFSLINYLRVMQKICKHKAHRNLLLVHYKSSNILRKSLKVPQQELRLYTLKLFKNQVPYCGRKWRQSNMRVITAIYLHCRPELRDEWLSGSDVDAEVEEALPLEQALRSLTHWFNVQRYPERMGAEVTAAMREERDFFTRELEKSDWMGWEGIMAGGGMGMDGAGGAEPMMGMPGMGMGMGIGGLPGMGGMAGIEYAAAAAAAQTEHESSMGWS
ncbi:protein required for hyphal anastomosis [Neurospora crassa]|uniref:Hyphal anastamosis protein 2 n=2 Tax=Neurospora crassa TaxID=5141 RepID=V5IL46_NEUCR|nr:hyphal anastamosis protein 2 [Neurospora crassa OR74A]ESA42443.1 hyphal anastamosis protein 2 [Neurospora crassa OR74A]KHE88208.1 protein required for hyphal anastomosis [Neurospora crassa]CAC28842.2 Protein required for hyphal anastomosis (HAM-2) [Neurospora crassa]|eukprot:XP_011394573.1 hyphal anastamosis protein 2 [Neurospora crassa OR74A]